MVHSIRTEYREKKRRMLMTIAFKCLSAAQMEKRYIEKLEMPILKDFFKWLNGKQEITKITEKNFYPESKNKVSSMLTQEQDNKDNEDFN